MQCTRLRANGSSSAICALRDSISLKMIRTEYKRCKERRSSTAQFGGRDIFAEFGFGHFVAQACAGGLGRRHWKEFETCFGIASEYEETAIGAGNLGDGCVALGNSAAVVFCVANAGDRVDANDKRATGRKLCFFDKAGSALAVRAGRPIVRDGRRFR